MYVCGPTVYAARAHRQLPHVRGHGPAAAHPRVQGLPGARGHEPHGRGRPHHPLRRPTRARTCRVHRRRTCRPSRKTCDALRLERPEVDAEGHRAHARDGRSRRAPDRARAHLRGRRQRLLPHRLLRRTTASSRAWTSRASRPARGSTTTATRRRTRATSCSGRRKTDEPAWAQWDAPFGRGRPGWHLECSAMSDEVPGRDVRPALRRRRPHRSRTTRTRSRRATAAPGKPFVRHWMHVEHLRDRRRDHVEEQGQRLHAARDRRARAPSRRGPLPAVAGRTTARR